MSRRPKEERSKAVQLVEKAILESQIAPGFDYAATVLALRRHGFVDDDIAAACSVGKSSPGSWVSGHEPGHAAGERLYILYVETFSERDEQGKISKAAKPPTKKPKLLGD
jgi:hypothetical protein